MAFVENTLGKRARGAQYKLVASGVVTQADLGAASDDVALFELPAGAVITDCHLHVTTLFDGTSPTLTVEALNLDGTDLTAAVVLDSAQAATSTGRFSTAITAAQIPVPCVVTIKNDVADSTVGAARVDVEYYIEGRSNENDG